MRVAGNGEGYQELYVMLVGGSRTVVRNNGLTGDGSGEERERAVVGPQKLPENNQKRGKRRGDLEFP